MALGHGHKARIYYAVWTLIMGVMLLVVAQMDDPQQSIFIALGVWVVGLVGLYGVFAGIDHVSEHPKVRQALKHGSGGSARWGGSGSLSKHEWKDD